MVKSVVFSDATVPDFDRKKGIALGTFRDFLLLAGLILSLLLNYSFMQIRILGIPATEALLLISLACINHRKVLPRFMAYGLAWPLMAWWVLGLIHILCNIGQYGVWAIRDGSHVIESLFMYVGFAFAYQTRTVNLLKKYFPVTLLLVMLYSLTYPFRAFLLPLLPSLKTSGNLETSLLLSYVNTAMVLLIGAAYFFNEYILKKQKRDAFLAISAFTIVLTLFPSRTLILEVVVLLAFFATRLRGRNLFYLLCFIVMPLLLGTVILSLVPLQGRFGSGFQLGNYVNLFLEILPGYSDADMMTSGTTGRIAWWSDILAKLMVSPWNLLLGLGYGMPLTDHTLPGGLVIREPHNDLISTLARGGIFALITLIWVHVLIMQRALKSFRHFQQRAGYESMTMGLLWILIFTLVAAIGEAPFIMAFYAFPYYFSAGILLRMYALRKNYD